MPKLYGLMTTNVKLYSYHHFFIKTLSPLSCLSKLCPIKTPPIVPLAAPIKPPIAVPTPGKIAVPIPAPAKAPLAIPPNKDDTSMTTSATSFPSLSDTHFALLMAPLDTRRTKNAVP